MMERSCCFVVKLAEKYMAVVGQEEQRLHLLEEQHEVFRRVFMEKSTDVRQRLRELKSATSFMQPFDSRRREVALFVQTGVTKLKEASDRLVAEGCDTTYKLSTDATRSLEEILEGFTDTLKHNEVHMRNCADKHPSCYSTFNRMFNEIITRAKWLKAGTLVLRQLVGYQKAIVLYDMYNQHIDNFEAALSRHPAPRHILTTRISPRPADETSPLSSFYHVVDLLNGDLLAQPTSEHLCWKYPFDYTPEIHEARPSVDDGGQKPKVYLQLGQVDHVSQKPQRVSQGYGQQSALGGQEILQSGYTGQNYQPQMNVDQPFLQPQKLGQIYNNAEQTNQRNGQPVPTGQIFQQVRPVRQGYFQPAQTVKTNQQKEQFVQVYRHPGQVGQIFQQQGQNGPFFVQTGPNDQLCQPKKQIIQLVQIARPSGQANQQTGQKRSQVGQVMQQTVQIGQTGVQQRSDIGQAYQQSRFVGNKQMQDRRPTKRALTFLEPSAESVTKLVQKPRILQAGTQGGAAVALMPKRGNPACSVEAATVASAPAHQTRRSGGDGATLSSGIHPSTLGAKKKVKPVILRKGPEKTFEIFSVTSPPGTKSLTELKPIKVPNLRSSNMKPLN